ncbi:alpha/beta fold hydrolase [Lederbergia wuyishanensis]|uniref:Pimeloyl-ACP methyl ester carboxylesterase n=1 Tax=Lederbergia wuyishanensis TaxID=1347903 RepID=A0ABU0D4D0_9BACI|nr:alpha/beta hydrolase [Lederbergia wuyishanensis]MCJ8008156.1 alpha/beta hydrolase [Lederbergia wuyishanensis]MDQ0343255.1 pimeloyl-ACP methyl ester carboxylesterase [Lederbergia wuyishanensis]
MNRKKKLIVICIFIFSLVLISFVLPTWTPNIKGKNSISTLEQVEINGTKLEVMIRGKDRSNPIIIFVHGGPGCSEIPYVRKYQDLLEENFTIVHYDQRGSGKSYHFFEDYSDLSTDLHVDDLLELTEHIKELLGQEKVILIGHSFGTYIGMKAASKAPDKFSMYIGIGQVSNTVQSELDSLNYTINQATLAGNQKDANKLENLRISIENGDVLTPRNLVRKYGGAARLINDNMDYYLGFLFSSEYNFLDVVRYIKGVSLSQKILIPEERKLDITSIVDKLEIPCFIVMGNYDYMTSVNAARTYFNEIEAPVKDFVIFDESAHYPQFEQKELFADWLNKTWEESNN